MGERERRSAGGTVRFLGAALVVALVAGIALDALTYVVARGGPQGDGWSLRGNGALIVPFGLGPAVLGAAWTALALRWRGSAHWLALGVAAGLVGALVVAAGVAVLILGVAAGQRASGALSVLALAWAVLPLAWAVVAPALAAWRGGAGRPAGRSLAVHVVAGALVALALVVGFSAAGAVLTPGA